MGLTEGENTGSYTWSPSKALESWESMPSGDIYGLKIVDDLTNTFEYSNPFSLSVPDSTYGGGTAATTSAKSAATTPAKTADTTAAATQATETKKEEETIKKAATTAPAIPVITNAEIQEAFVTVTEDMSATADAAAVGASTTASAAASATTTAAASKSEPTNIFAVVAGVICGLALIVAVIILFIRLRKDKTLMANAPPDPKVGLGGMRTPIDPEIGAGTGAAVGAVAGGHRRNNSAASMGGRRDSEEFSQRDVIKPQFTGAAASTASPVATHSPSTFSTPQNNYPAAASAVVVPAPVRQPQQRPDQYQMQQHPQHTQYPQSRPQQPPYPSNPGYPVAGGIRGPPVQNRPYGGQQQGGSGGYRPNQYQQPRGPAPAAYNPNGYQARPPQQGGQGWPIP